ncbi:MAG: hypothetical protein H6970_00505 [Gammaproteobacteria bacterium]|nr:hypothetical protein [Gammaproteobacteria bacterium]MCP5423540.1 hypothetical protein [Gammaproteobacteria bacterium]
MHAAVKIALPRFLAQAGVEGKYNHMYLDIKGLVTVGVGYLIDSVASAQQLEFRTKGGGIASSGQVAEEWNKVKSRTDLIKKGGAAFAAMTTLELSNNGIESMMARKIEADEKYLKTNPVARKYYGSFNAYPADAQMAILGIAYGIMPIPPFGWNKFPEACHDGDFLTASQECSIKNAPPKRNSSHKLMLENADAVIYNQMDIDQLWHPTVLLRQVK